MTDPARTCAACPSPLPAGTHPMVKYCSEPCRYAASRQSVAKHQKKDADKRRSDPCSKAGAEKLKAQIERYWADRGKAVSIKIVEGPFLVTQRSVSWWLRSDMVDGRPRPTTKE